MNRKIVYLGIYFLSSMCAFSEEPISTSSKEERVEEEILLFEEESEYEEEDLEEEFDIG